MDVILMNLGLLVLGLLWLLLVFALPFTSAYAVAFLFMYFKGIANYYVFSDPFVDPSFVFYLLFLLATLVLDMGTMRKRFLALEKTKKN